MPRDYSPLRLAMAFGIALAAAVPAHATGRFGPADVYARVPPIDDRGRDQLSMFNRWNPDPIGNHARNLASVRPDLAAVVRKAQGDNPGIRFVVGSGARSEGQQRQAEAWGWSPRVHPFARSPSLRKHLEGMAVDLWPLDEQNRVVFSPAQQSRVAGAMMRAARDLGVRLSWGGNWRRKKDPTHFELMR
ncbi:M15 family metallopeptidase [Enterovirga rhinocerotis]|uniref:D-alanyl-D-alanine carboxypeptidase-like protein n=1 Tax=Enterovirga rhinocerotis TaxID=1339210 RepID=A0A4R7BX12_9HYPH|nr:M15 family metallopeptidase [Enterovirga rhinocerotis]TDR90121.1 D-alanyl-D-alanine carboxypeptidase-like protein [Enterovirga rhinocerotis]